MSKPSLLVLPPPSLYHQLFDPESHHRLLEVARVTFNSEERNWSSGELAQRLPGFAAVVTGWGTPLFDEQVLAAAEDLQLIAHSAGSIKRMLPPAVFARGIAVTHAAGAIAPAVAEMTILLILLGLRRVLELDRLMKAGEPWSAGREIGMGREIRGLRVGVVGAGYTGREVIQRLKALGADVWVYDPYVGEARAAELGVYKGELDELFAQCPVVTIQAPPTEETHHMIGARQLALMPEGALFVNTARSRVVDQEVLLDELHKGRIRAALDVYDQEPLPLDSPFRALDNVILTPHVAGATQQARLRQGRTVVEEVERFFAGQALQYPVTGDMLATMA